MQASGLTVGGFYKHFRSKDELLGDAIAEGFSESSEKIYSSLQNVPREDRWKDLVRLYLSPEHCDHPDSGCPVAALAPEMARAKLGVRKQISGLIKDRAVRWVEFMPGRTAAERERNFVVIFAAMVGAVSVARIFTESADRHKVLADMRDPPSLASSASWNVEIRRSAFDHIAKSNVIVADKSGQAHAVRRRFVLIWRMVAFDHVGHESHLLGFAVKRIW
jgi:TetR/AcrR family transcriptional repressor of nem operon